jgi:general secretion pathway protein E
MTGLTATIRSPDSGFRQDPLGEQLVSGGKLSSAELKRVIALPHKSADSLAIQLVRLGQVAEADVAALLSKLTGLPVLDSTEYPDIAITSAVISPRYMKAVYAIPVDESDDEIRLAMADPRASHVIRAISVASDKTIIPCLGLQSDIDRAIDRCYGDGRSEMGKLSNDDENGDGPELDVEQLRDMASEAPVIRVVNHMIQQAVDLRASDIHIEPFSDRLIVRLRVDGVLREIESPPPRMTAAVISRIKIMSKLNIAERRLPQDGRIMLKLRGKEIDFRISTVPTLHGESVVMRLLDKKGVPLDFAPLGFLPEQEKQLKEILHMPNGIVLVTGPTGSGKTTTLYAALNHLNSTERKILTVEDPVEYQLQGINQIHVKSKIGLDFPSALRSRNRTHRCAVGSDRASGVIHPAYQ